MESLYQIAGISKQGHYKRVGHHKKMQGIAEEVLAQAQQVRKEHKRMGCRKLYAVIKPQGIGRDKTEALLLSHGFRVERKRNYHRTTYAGASSYPNHISGMQVKDVNQLWVSDLTYITVSYARHYYLTLVQDVYSRKIVGWELSQGMQAEQTVIPAYQMAVGQLSKQQCEGLIFHSDRGSQYIDQGLGQLHNLYGVVPSMGGKAWENAHAESINGVLKNEYINFQGMDIALLQARKMVKNIIRKYNQERPHGSLKNMKPQEFENFVHQLAAGQKPVVTINY